ncbi:hypothetical protein CNEO_90238 [Clostridium neonatale]|nr:hypothetical protein CNEO_90238 [Clostridium neonatale]CAI3613587.1 hypothetical protein CNEO4_240039 [Clostridium neonatale]
MIKLTHKNKEKNLRGKNYEEKTISYNFISNDISIICRLWRWKQRS